MLNEFLIKIPDGTVLQGYSWRPEQEARAVVVIIHGLGEYALRFEEYARFFALKGLAVYSMDLRGHGRSSGKRGHTAPRSLILKDIETLCQKALEFYPQKPLFLYGHSMGGNLVLFQRIKGNIRPRGYIVTSPWIRLYRRVSGLQIGALRALSWMVPAFRIPSGIESSDLTSDETQIIPNDPVAHGVVSIKTALDCNDCAKEILKTAHEPMGELLLFHGTSDHICDIEGSREFMRHAHQQCTYKEWENSRHELQHEKNREEVRDWIYDWINARL